MARSIAPQLILLTAAAFTGCSPSTAPSKPARTDLTSLPGYIEAVEELASLNGEAETLAGKGKLIQAGELITRAQPLAARILSVPRPTLAGMEAASDHDDLYGRLLLANRHYGWARMFFQKNVARWTNWKPQTAEADLRRKRAEYRIEECDRLLEKQSRTKP